MSKLSETLEELESLQEEYTGAYDDVIRFIDAARREHEDGNHAGHFRWCKSAGCSLASEKEQEYPR